MCLPPLEEAFALVLVCVDEAYSSVCISRRYGTLTYIPRWTRAKLGRTGDASVHALWAGDVMNSSGIVVFDGAVLSAGRVRWRR